MKRKIEHLSKKIAEYNDRLDHAATPEEIEWALRMKRIYENALLSLEEKR